MASNVVVTTNGDNSNLTASSPVEKNQLTLLKSQETQYYSIDSSEYIAQQPHRIQEFASVQVEDDTDSSSESEYEDAHEHPMPPEVPSPYHHLPMPLDDYLEGRGDESPPTGLQERHSTLPSENIRARMRKDFDLRPSKSDPNLGDHLIITDLDSGKKYELHEAADHIPQGITLDPLSNTLKMRTPGAFQEVGVGTMDDSSITTDTPSEFEPKEKKVKRRSLKGVVKSAKHMFKKRNKVPSNGRSLPTGIKFKASSRLKTPPRYQRIELIQELPSTHVGPIWTMKFSSCGKLLATGGQDKVLRIWCLNSARDEFIVLKEKYKKNNTRGDGDITPNEEITVDREELPTPTTPTGPFGLTPFAEYKGHYSDILDISWSNNYFMLTSSMDKTVRLWHVALDSCLSIFEHKDFVTAIAFYPNDERYFISGSLDGKLRLWHVIEKKVLQYNEVPNSTGSGSRLITAANYCYNGKLAVIGTYDGKCVFYDSDHLKYHTQVHVRSKHGKNTSGHKITGIIPHPTLPDRLLVTSNDSRIRLYNLRDYKLECKYKGYVNTETQSKATFSPTGEYIICGSQDHMAYIWRMECDLNFKHARRDRNPCYECFSAHNSVITVAIFAPNLEPFANFSPTINRNELDSPHDVILTADYYGQIKIFSL